MQLQAMVRNRAAEKEVLSEAGVQSLVTIILDVSTSVKRLVVFLYFKLDKMNAISAEGISGYESQSFMDEQSNLHKS